MRHRVYGKHLGRNRDERQNLFKGLLSSIFTYGFIQTSDTKAKAIKGLVDRVVNLAKDKQNRRLQSFLADSNLRERLIKEIAPKLGGRNSGYTSLVKVGTRLGDQTMMVRMSLIGVEQLSDISRQSSDKGKSVVSKSVTGKQKTDKRKIKKAISRRKK